MPNGSSFGRSISVLIPGLFILILNSAYLFAFDDPTIFYIANVLLHLGLGLLLLFLLVLMFRRISKLLNPIGRASLILLLIAGLLGAALIFTGSGTHYHWLLHSHIAAAVAGVLLLAISLAKFESKLAWKALSAVLILAFIFPAAVFLYRHKYPSKYDRIVNPESPPLNMDGEGGGPQSPFFPSSAETTSKKTIPSTFFLTSESCKRCHPDIYEQWFSSAHHFSSFNNQWYRKSIEYMQDTIGTRPSKWCGGCHDHAVLFNGMMDTPIKQIIDTKEAQAGLACTSCHAIVHVRSSMGQGDFEIEYPALHDLSVSKNRYLQWLHDFVVNLDPEPHRKVFMKPFVRKNTAEFCSSCHKVHLDIPVNNYRWFRGFNDYDNWQASGVSGQGARSFYYPPKPKKCADCHMPLVDGNDPASDHGKIKSHRFPGANTALPLVNHDEVQLRTVQNFLQDNQVTVDIFAISEAEPLEKPQVRPRTSEGPDLASTFAIGEESMSFGDVPSVIRKPAEIVAPIDRVGAFVKRGDTVRVDVVVRTRGVGHFFPGGTVDAFDVWLELQAKDEQGRVIFWSGRIEDNGKGQVEKGAHFYRTVLIDEHGNWINKRNAWAARSVAYVRLIPPGAADTAHFRLTIPEDCGNKIFLKAKLNYRKFMWWNTQFAFAGIPDPGHADLTVDKSYDDRQWVFTGDTSKVSGKIKSIPDLPITTMDEADATLKVVDAKENLNQTAKLDPKDRERWNDYGIGLLLQGDLKGAEAAFIKVTEVEPKYADGWVNIGRARIQEGDINGAQTVLKKALELNPELAKTHFFYAMTLKSQGRYSEALEHLKKTIDQYPRDRVVRNQIGRILFLQRKFNEAIAEFKQTLLVDPEDLQAHYNLMLCYQGLGKQDLADREQILYLRFKADESSQTITGPYRKLHPEDNNERQPIHEHTSIPLDQKAS